MTVGTASISQRELEEIVNLRREIAEEKTRLDELESTVKNLLIARAPIEEGRFFPHLFTRRFHHVAWRQIVINELGAVFADACWKSSPSNIVSKVIVEEHAILPLWKTANNGS